MRDARRDGACCFQAIETGDETMRPFRLISEVLDAAHLAREQVECLALGVGPGSYTGIRSAIALAQGWQLGTGVKLLAISSSECVAWQAQRDGVRGLTHVVIDAQRNEFYLASYELLDQSVTCRKPLHLSPREALEDALNTGGIPIGPEVTKWFSGGRIVYPTAEALVELARNRRDFMPGEHIEPIYLRQTSFVKAPPPRPLPE